MDDTLDVARHFYPVQAILRQLPVLSYNKFNALHLHISDSQAFPLNIPNWPELSKFGAYGPDQMYTLKDLQILQAAAQHHGIAIVPEIDVPSHLGYGWQWGPLRNFGDLILCFSKRPDPTTNCFGPPCGYLNLANENVYKILADIYHNLTNIFGPQATYHLGGDEVNIFCWKNNSEMQKWLTNQNLTASSDDLHKVWANFEKTILAMIQSHILATNVSKKSIIWSSSLTKGSFINYVTSAAKLGLYIFQIASRNLWITPKLYPNLLTDIKNNIVVQVWDPSKSESVPSLLKDNFNVISSTYDAWYLNCGFPWWVGEGPNKCGPVQDWRKMYNNRPYKGLYSKWNITDPIQRSHILGGEVCLWSETIDETSLDSMIWPRAAAVAERLWSDPDTCWWEANARFLSHRERLKVMGLNAEPVAPEFCIQNPQHCIIPPDLWEHFDVTSSCQEFESNAETTTQHVPKQTKTSSNKANNFGLQINYLFIPFFLLLLHISSIFVLTAAVIHRIRLEY